MKVHGSREFLVLLTALLLWTGVVHPAAPPAPQANPFPESSSPARENSAPAGGDSAGEDGSLPTDYLMEEARNAAEHHDFVIAEALYQTVLLRERQNLPAILELASVYEKTGKLEYARGLLLRAAVLRPHDEKIIAMNREISELLSTVLREEVDSLIARRQCELALPKLSMLLTIEPENPDFYYKKAICHLEIGKPETALIHIDDALRLQKNVDYFHLRDDITKRIEKNRIEGLLANAQSLLRNGSPANRERALQVISEILQMDPEHVWARRSFIILSNGETPPDGWIEAAGIENGAAAETGNHPDVGEGDGGMAGVWRDRRTLVPLAVSIAALFFGTIAFIGWRSKPAVPPLSGRFSHFSLREILDLIEASARTGVLRVHSKFTGGEIYFKNGEACHCKAGSLTGSEAFSLLVDKMRAGTFQFLDCAPPLERTIDTSSLPQSSQAKPSAPATNSGGAAPVKSRRPKSRMKVLLESKK